MFTPIEQPKIPPLGNLTSKADFMKTEDRSPKRPKRQTTVNFTNASESIKDEPSAVEVNDKLTQVGELVFLRS